jgi:hypothetical protein
VHHFERVLLDELDPPDGLPEWIVDEHLTPLLEEAIAQAADRPPPRIVRLDRAWTW